MSVNIIIGLVLAAVLLFDFVYLPLEHEWAARGRITTEADRPKDGAPPRGDAGPGRPGAPEQDADERIDALKKQLDGEHARVADLDRDLAATQDRLARTDRDKIAAEVARRDIEVARRDAEAKRADAEAAHADAEAKLDQERRLATDLADRLSAARSAGAAREEALERRVDAERARAAALDRDLAAARARPPRPDHDAGRDAPGPPRQSASKEDDATAAIALPDHAPARVTLRYARGNATARSRAASLKSTLEVQGLDVGDPLVAPQDARSSGIAYYYDEDRDSADRVATLVGSSGPVKVKIPKREKIRPGRVDVMVAG